MGSSEKSRPGPEFSQSGRPADLAPGLYITATPIGNARDVSLRALDVLKACDLIAAEDTRVTAKLLAIHGISKPLTAYNDHNGPSERPKLIGKLKRGARIALVSDAGTPLVSDPGYKLVREAIVEGIAIHAVPGASSVLTALTLAGLPTDRFFFAGFLPSKSGERRNALAQFKSVGGTLIFFESAQRLAESLKDIEAVLGNRPAVVTRELTKLHEEIRRGDLVSLAAHYEQSQTPKGEVTLVIGAPLESAPDFARADGLLQKALVFMPVRAAADLVAEALAMPRRALYERALALKEKS
ncbi:MAG: 16S rRNA (cytidine(1402)-2'-O)-methyltransferase [Rhizomicrobium sp.]